MDKLKTKITGIITPSKWDQKGDVIGISLQGVNEVEYIVNPGKRGRELFNYINEKIAIEGKIKDRLDGKKIVIDFNPQSASLRVVEADDDVRWMYSFWFAWYAMRPETEVFEP